MSRQGGFAGQETIAVERVPVNDEDIQKEWNLRFQGADKQGGHHDKDDGRMSHQDYSGRIRQWLTPVPNTQEAEARELLQL